MSALPGQLLASNDFGPIAAIHWPSFGRSGIADVVPTARAKVERQPVARIDAPAEPHVGPYRQVDTAIDHRTRTFWCHLRPEGAPSFNRGILRELAHMQRGIMRLFDDADPDADLPFRYLVVASRLPGIFNMGGDLGFFADRIRAGDRDALTAYARACIEVVYNNAIALDLPIITIALVQGDALGGGFEAALCCNVIVGGKSAEIGLREILCNL